AVAEDRAELVGSTDIAVQVQQALSHAIQCSPSCKDQVGAVLDLAAEQPIDAIDDPVGISAGIKRHQLTQPALHRDLQIRPGQASGEVLQTLRVSTVHEGVGRLTEEDALTLELACQPLMLVDADSRVEWEVGRDTHEHASPLAVAQVEVVLPDEAC